MGTNKILKKSLEDINEKIKRLSEELNLTNKLWCQEGWSTRDKPFYKQNFKKNNYWHRIRSRCF